jgi:hypothetical protein
MLPISQYPSSRVSKRRPGSQGHKIELNITTSTLIINFYMIKKRTFLTSHKIVNYTGEPVPLYGCTEVKLQYKLTVSVQTSRRTGFALY